MTKLVVGEELPSWASLNSGVWPVLLIGNGLSINLWSRFNYSSLYRAATLTSSAKSIFTGLKTRNFEAVLESIHHSHLVLKALGRSTRQVDNIYAMIRDALFGAVGKVHVPWEEFPDSTHRKIAKWLDGHSCVFTTNYDLCLYWSQVRNLPRVKLVDYLWDAGKFNPSDVDLRPNQTPIHYLHGAIHLWQDDNGENGKWINADSGSLLQLASRYSSAAAARRPLFVSEGTSPAKLRTIKRSSYLSFCLRSLTEDVRPILIFGHSLSEQDRHIVDAIKAGPKRDIAFAMYPTGDPEGTVQEKARIKKALKPHTVYFFDSTTHPLGKSTLRIG
ncbi:DUF4917 family protein [Tenggerimyces flavus]|uniref:DUF4917 family protein n=1 Tax=Tenggerimyces flavus TaxID=1708749 RepID=A0ABV7Y8W5_9ACTN|nr:DUF4917 family protein [Tenggerimyces flavus]MBM7783561.1 hypothetical protein [Tenggerimyces flavus]